MDKREKVNLYIDFILFALGLFFVFNYSDAFSVFVMVIGAVCIIYGILMSVMYFIHSKAGNKNSVWNSSIRMWIGFVYIIIGAAVLIFEKSISDDGMKIILGVWMLLMGVYKVILAFEFGRYGGGIWKLSAFSALISFAMCGLIIASYCSVNYAFPDEWISVISGVYFIIFASLGFGESVMINYLRKKNPDMSETVSKRTRDKIQREVDAKNIGIGICFDEDNEKNNK